MYRVCIPLFSRCVFLTRIPWQLFSDEQSRRSPGRVWSGIWNPISSHWHLDPYNCRLYYIYRLYILLYYCRCFSRKWWFNLGKTRARRLRKTLPHLCLCRTCSHQVGKTYLQHSTTYHKLKPRLEAVQMSAGNKWANCWFRLGSTRIAWTGTGSSLA